MALAALLKKNVSQVEELAGKAGADTIRLWERYREQALLWRALALLQMPATLLAIILTLVIAVKSNPILEVPLNPLPGRYSSAELPDRIFIAHAMELVNLVASYQPSIARRHFKQVETMLWEPALSKFQAEMLETELKHINETDRSQLFFVNQDKIKIERFPERDLVRVRIAGVQRRLIGTKPLPPQQIVYYVTMSTIGQQSLNRYGIVVLNVDSKEVSFRELID
jgi:hypothetical protein